MSSNKPVFKIVLLGEGRVGKTSLVLRYVKNTFSDSQKCTIQATYLQKDVKLPDQTVTLSIWDTAGQERFHALGPIYYRNADGALLVYDVTDQDTFVRAKNWVKELRKVVGPDIVLTIAGNKCDLKNRQVNEEEVLKYAESVNAEHILTSAKANKRVDEAFLNLTKRIIELKKKQKNDTIPERGHLRQNSLDYLDRKPSKKVIKIEDEEEDTKPRQSCSCG